MDQYEIIEIHSKDEAIKRGKHCGWCTADANSSDYDDFYQFGRLFVLYKNNKRRPSYQLFTGTGVKNHCEFRKKGNESFDPW